MNTIQAMLNGSQFQLQAGGSCVIMSNYDQFVTKIQEDGLSKFISFDHDLADFHYKAMLRECNGEENVDYGSEKTGYDCTKWLVEYCLDNALRIPEFQVHSLNPIGTKNIEMYLENSAKYVYKLNKA